MLVSVWRFDFFIWNVLPCLVLPYSWFHFFKFSVNEVHMVSVLIIGLRTGKSYIWISVWRVCHVCHNFLTLNFTVTRCIWWLITFILSSFHFWKSWKLTERRRPGFSFSLPPSSLKQSMLACKPVVMCMRPRTVTLMNCRRCNVLT